MKNTIKIILSTLLIASFLTSCTGTKKGKSAVSDKDSKPSSSVSMAELSEGDVIRDVTEMKIDIGYFQNTRDIKVDYVQFGTDNMYEDKGEGEKYDGDKAMAMINELLTGVNFEVEDENLIIEDVMNILGASSDYKTINIYVKFADGQERKISVEKK